jgi:flavin-dependent dehydrogenase
MHPVAIAQISFDRKTLVEDHMLMVGDASGMITPLCGNGMSMALHESKIAYQLLTGFLSGTISRRDMEIRYQVEWRKYFDRRLKTGRFIQSMFGKKWLSNIFIQSMKPFPKLIRYLIRQTHGEPF